MFAKFSRNHSRRNVVFVISQSTYCCYYYYYYYLKYLTKKSGQLGQPRRPRSTLTHTVKQPYGICCLTGHVFKGVRKGKCDIIDYGLLLLLLLFSLPKFDSSYWRCFRLNVNNSFFILDAFYILHASIYLN